MIEFGITDEVVGPQYHIRFHHGFDESVTPTVSLISAREWLKSPLSAEQIVQYQSLRGQFCVTGPRYLSRRRIPSHLSWLKHMPKVRLEVFSFSTRDSPVVKRQIWFLDGCLRPL
jgi:hypothetical protein